MKHISGVSPTTAVNGMESTSDKQPETAPAIRNPEPSIPVEEIARPNDAEKTPAVESAAKVPHENAEDQWPRQQPFSDKEKREKRKERTWLMDDPQGWVGRRVKCRRNMAVYTVAQIYKNGRVSLERNWMSYFTDVETVRKDYDTYC